MRDQIIVKITIQEDFPENYAEALADAILLALSERFASGRPFSGMSDDGERLEGTVPEVRMKSYIKDITA